jgi:hypothetical protein
MQKERATSNASTRTSSEGQGGRAGDQVRQQQQAELQALSRIAGQGTARSSSGARLLRTDSTTRAGQSQGKGNAQGQDKAQGNDKAQGQDKAKGQDQAQGQGQGNGSK